MKTAAVIGPRSTLGRQLVAQLDALGIAVLTVGRLPSDDIVFDLRTGSPDVRQGLSADAVFHCAAVFGDDSAAGLLDNFTANAAAAIGVADLARRLNAATLVYAGSVFSDKTLEPGNFTSYGLTKSMAEQMLDWASAKRSARFCSLRFAQIYDTEGACCAHQAWFGRIIAYASRGQDIRMPPSLGARNFLHVEDAAALMIRAATRHVWGLLNIVHPQSLTCEEIAAIAHEIFDLGGKIVIDPAKSPFRHLNFPDAGTAFSQLGTGPAIDMRTGIARIKAAGTAGQFGPMDLT